MRAGRRVPPARYSHWTLGTVILGSPFPTLTFSFWDSSGEAGCQKSEVMGKNECTPAYHRVPQLLKALEIAGLRAQAYRTALAKANMHGHRGVFGNGLQAHYCSKGRDRWSTKGGHGGLLVYSTSLMGRHSSTCVYVVTGRYSCLGGKVSEEETKM